MKQMEFVSNRDIVVRSLHGHAIEFKKGVPTQVPRVMHAECLEKGILPVESNEQGSAIQDAPGPNLAPEDKLERDDAILEVIKQIVKRNNSNDFVGGGHPSAVTISSAVGWKVDQKEVKEVWVKNREALIRAVDQAPKE